MSEPIKPRISAIQNSQTDPSFNNSLAALLMKGNPNMKGLNKTKTMKEEKPEEETKEKIKFDIFNNEEEDGSPVNS